jgi:hypothetical protein
MTLSNRRDRVDRISDLPGNVIDGILKHLNIRERVRTSILSRKWKYMWTSVRYEHLLFDKDFFSRFEDLDDPGPEISRIITEVLFLHNGPIYSFTLEIPFLSDFLITNEYLNKWILFLSRRGIKDLQLLNHGISSGILTGLPVMKMPSFVFSCHELTHFRLEGFNLSVLPNFFGLKSLLVLHLGCNRYDLGSLESLIAGCPLLEKLSIQLYRDMKSICLKNAKNLVDLSLTVNRDRVAGFIKSLPKIQRLAIESDSDEVRKQHH